MMRSRHALACLLAAVTLAPSAAHAQTPGVAGGLKAAPIRAWVDAWRKAPGQATDFVSDYAMGYDPAAGRVVVRTTVGSMTSGKLSQPAFDPGNGSAVALAAAPRPVPSSARAGAARPPR